MPGQIHSTGIVANPYTWGFVHSKRTHMNPIQLERASSDCTLAGLLGNVSLAEAALESIEETRTHASAV